ncbi:thiamine-phosphate kinase [soil metagenome]
MNEFALIRQYFQRELPASTRSGIGLGIGDDCALLAPLPGEQIAVSTDTLVEGRHFFADVDPHALGHKALAVNLSDLAAMGAKPLGCLLALTLPVERASDDRWMAGFSAGLLDLAMRFECPLIGGDTTRGPLTIGVTVLGSVASARALRRSGAGVDDDLWVSGTLGDAAFALQALQGTLDDPASHAAATALRERLERPQPRVALGLELAGLATSAIDLSDGLAGDLAHVLRASAAGAVIDLESIPMTGALRALDPAQALRLALAGGDDYELCFTARAVDRERIVAAAKRSATAVGKIGRIVAQPGIVWRSDGTAIPLDLDGHDHFR